MLAGPVLAQNAAGQRGEAGPAVAAASTAAGVRFVAPGEARRIRIEIYTADGTRLFDSGFRAGGIYDWDGRGLADGSYLCMLTAEDIQGGQSRRLSSVTVAGGRVELGKDGGEQLKASYAKAIAAAGIESNEAEAAARAKKSNAVTVTAHDGTDGQVTSTAGALTFRTGDVFNGTEREQMRVTPEGRVGIGTASPEDALDVAGTIRARGGIRFDDGTVLTSAGGVKSGMNLASTSTLSSDGQTAANLAGTGTANKLAKWVDGAGTLGDSVITEVGGQIGIGTASPTAPLDIVYNNNSFGFGFNIKNTNAGTQALTGYGINNASDQRVGQFVYVPSNYTNASLRDTLLFSSAGPATALGFVSSADGAGKPDIFFRAGTGPDIIRLKGTTGLVGIGTSAPADKLEVVGNVRVTGAGNGIIFADGSKMTTAAGGGGSTPSGTSIVSAINDPVTAGTISENRLSTNVARRNAANTFVAGQVFSAGLSANNALITNVGNPVNAGDATNKAYTDANFVKFVPGAEQLSVGDANGTAPMINLRGGSTCCSGPGGHTPAWFKVFQNGSFVATGNLGIGVSPMQGKGYRTSWDSYKGAFRSGYADNEWDDNTVGFFSWAGGSNSTAEGLYAFAFGDTNFARSTSSIAFGSGNEVKGAAGFSAGAGNRVCDTYGVA
ncbi:MAG TPA: hypothetical protein VF621_09140, partial [Pyrinomonadaceae bacterium]